MAQTRAGWTPKGHELYREVGTSNYFVRVKIDDGSERDSEQHTVADPHKRRPIGRFGSFTEAATYVDTTTNG